ncbi:MAG: hypothetical protein P1T08_13200 [Acidimicrobiia bacterium]|nr:hypothetical protein [Acidimicrobiia bacterium]
MQTWGNEPKALWDSLQRTPGRFALIVGDLPHSTLDFLSSQWDTPITNAGHLLTVADENGWKTPEDSLRGSRLLTGFDVLFWPTVMVDPLRLLRTLAAHQPVVAEWPGRIADGRATYSSPGRPDYYDNPIPKGIVVLHPLTATFPDELPYQVERIS